MMRMLIKKRITRRELFVYFFDSCGVNPNAKRLRCIEYFDLLYLNNYKIGINNSYVKRKRKLSFII